MKEFFKPNLFKIVVGAVIFLVSFIVAYVLFRAGYKDSIFGTIFWPAAYLRDLIGDALGLRYTICPTFPPCFDAYPRWIIIVSFIVVLYFYGAII